MPGLARLGSAQPGLAPSRQGSPRSDARPGDTAAPLPPRALPLSPGSVTIYSAPDERGQRSIFSSAQKVPIYLGAPALTGAARRGEGGGEWAPSVTEPCHGTNSAGTRGLAPKS